MEEKVTEEKVKYEACDDFKVDLEGKSLQEIQEELQIKLNVYKEKVKATTNLEELKQLEDDILKEQEKFDNYLRSVEYDLPQDPIEFDGKSYTLSEITRRIVYYLNRNEQDFQYCLGLHGLVKIWKTSPLTKISYGVLDSTLRILGGLKYKGDTEWVDILVINNYLTAVHEPYIKDRAMLITLAEAHNAVVDQTQKCTPVDANGELKESK